MLLIGSVDSLELRNNIKIVSVNRKLLQYSLIFPLLSLCFDLRATETNYENGIVSNKFLEIEIGTDWNAITYEDYPFGGFNYIFQNKNNSTTTLGISSVEYQLGSRDMEFFHKINLDTVPPLVGIEVSQEEFTTYEGYRVFATHDYYPPTDASGGDFEINGTTSNYDGNENEWFHVKVLYSSTPLLR